MASEVEATFLLPKVNPGDVSILGAISVSSLGVLVLWNQLHASERQIWQALPFKLWIRQSFGNTPKRQPLGCRLWWHHYQSAVHNPVHCHQNCWNCMPGWLKYHPNASCIAWGSRAKPQDAQDLKYFSRANAAQYGKVSLLPHTAKDELFISCYQTATHHPSFFAVIDRRPRLTTPQTVF